MWAVPGGMGRSHPERQRVDMGGMGGGVGRCPSRGVTHMSTKVLLAAALSAASPIAVTASELGAPAPIRQQYVTSDFSGSHTTIAGTPVYGGFNHDGVGQVVVSSSALAPGTVSIGSGNLLSSGNALLTAAHVVADDDGNILPDIQVHVRWNLPGGISLSSPVTATVTKVPSYNGNPTLGGDLAIVSWASPIDSRVPRYDIYRGSNAVAPGVANIHVGYGGTGHGSTGNTVGATLPGTKRAGLQSYDMDARAVRTPLNTSAPVTGDGLAYDFDSGAPAHDVFTYNPLSQAPHLGFGADEVGSAPGDSGGGSFRAANDTRVSITSSGGHLGSVIVGAAIPTQNIGIEKVGDNGTTLGLNYAGDAVEADTTLDLAGTLSEFKIVGVTSYGFGFNSLPDVSPGTNSSWGEVAVDVNVSHHQNFVAPFLAAEGSGGTTAPLTINTSTAGAKSASLTIDNLASTAEFANSGSNDSDDVISYTANVLAHSEASFNASADQNTLTLDFGTVLLNEAVSPLAFSIANLESVTGFTAGLDLDSILGTGDTGVLTTNLSEFFDLLAGERVDYLASFDTSTLGVFSATYTLAVSDEDLLGAADGESLVLTLAGSVIPEPASALLLLGGLAALARRRALA